jgi:hypothetical protein
MESASDPSVTAKRPETKAMPPAWSELELGSFEDPLPATTAAPRATVATLHTTVPVMAHERGTRPPLQMRWHPMPASVTTPTAAAVIQNKAL